MEVLIVSIVGIVVFLLYFNTDFYSSDKGKSNNSSYIIRSNTEIVSLINRLDQLGYYKYVERTRKREIKKDAMSAGCLFGWEQSGREFMSDAESLAEGGVGEFIKAIDPFLRTQNVQITKVNDDLVDTDYSVEINGESYKIYSGDELHQNIWELSTIRAFGIVNKLLEAASSDERVYILYGGNELRAVFLTSKMFKVINGSKFIPDKDKPIMTPEYA
ncbi:hypothetical protein [Cohnella soli]|uniref:Uncharacterized protein n=1 Tax=Cohnella soli TaxID=425005 RepID=A0ABW0HND1_9BACL